MFKLPFQSLAIANAAYDSQWMDQNNNVKKIIYIMIMRAQKPLVLNIGAFGVMNAESALTVRISSQFYWYYNWNYFQTMKAAYTYVSIGLQR